MFSGSRVLGSAFSSVRTIARQHGGDVVAESAGEGRGATVRLELPRVLSAA